MKTNIELYGTDELPQVDEYVIMRRLGLLRDTLALVRDQHYMVRDTELENAVLKEITRWSTINDK